ncbi:MAG: glycosyltransferase [Lutisporaceae bacterium]
MKLSVIIPAFNNVEYVHMTLTALKQQRTTFNDWEVLLVDDSYDNQMSQFETWDFPSLRVINKEHSGRTDTRNVGITSSLGDILVFMDSDMIVESDFVQSHYEKHQDSNCDILLGKVNHISFEHLEDVRKIVYSETQSISEIENYVVGDSYLDLTSLLYSNPEVSKRIGWICCLFSNCSVKRKAIEKSGLFDTEFIGWGLEDIEMGYRFHLNGYSFQHSNQVKNYHVDHATNGDRMLSDMSANLKRMYKKHHDNNIRCYMSFVAGFRSITSFLNEISKEEIEFKEGNEVFFKPIQYVKSKSLKKLHD